MAEFVEVQGVTALRKQFDALPKKVQAKVARKAVREAAKVIQKDAKSRAPRRTGLLRKSIKVRRAKRKQSPFAVTDFVMPQDPGKSPFPFYWRFLEGGWNPSGRAKRRVGAARRLQVGSTTVKHPFLGPAYESRQEAAMRTFESTFAEELRKLVL